MSGADQPHLFRLQAGEQSLPPDSKMSYMQGNTPMLVNEKSCHTHPGSNAHASNKHPLTPLSGNVEISGDLTCPDCEVGKVDFTIHCKGMYVLHPSGCTIAIMLPLTFTLSNGMPIFSIE